MKKRILIAAILVIVGGIGTLFILHEKMHPVVTKISAANPLALEIKRERSFFQAKKIQNRLRDQGLQTYIMALEDTAQSGQWYSILAEATADSTVLDSITRNLKVKFNLDSLQVIDFKDTTSAFADTDTLKIVEKKRIHESIPLVPEATRSIIYHFPNTDFFYIKEFKLVNFMSDSMIEIQWYDKILNQFDLPRGLSLTFFQNIGEAWAEAIYKDNLYGDQVTIDILRLRPTVAFLPDSARRDIDSLHFHIAAFLGQKILNTGDYSIEQKNKIVLRQKDPLRGYRIVIESRPHSLQTYMILVDKSARFVYFCQSSKKAPDELNSIMELIDRGEGIDEYDEFHNTFFTMPSILPVHDVFISFQLNKLDWDYAKNKNYSQWSKQMVGHWYGTGHFIDTMEKNLWSFSLFDLLTTDKLQLTYLKFYAGERKKEEATEVYGTTGYNIICIPHPYDKNKGNLCISAIGRT